MVVVVVDDDAASTAVVVVVVMACLNVANLFSAMSFFLRYIRDCTVGSIHHTFLFFIVIAFIWSCCILQSGIRWMLY